MAKLTLTDLASLQNQLSALSTINSNYTLIEAAIENTLSRDGTTPNSMSADLDMNDNSILNLPYPSSPTQPLRLGDLVALLETVDVISVDSVAGNASKLVKVKDDEVGYEYSEATITDAGALVLPVSLDIAGTTVIDSILDEDDLTSDSDTALATQQSIKAYVDSQVTAQDLDFQGDTGGALSIDLDTESLTIAGGTGIDTSGATNTLTVAIDSTVATLDDTQTLTNKTVDLTDNTLTGTISQFNSALSDEDFATLDGTETLTNKTINLTSNTLTSTIAQLQTAVTDATLLTTADEGSGNGIDADTVDGVHAAAFALDTDIGTTIQAYDVDTLKADVADVLTAGFAATDYNAGTKSSGTYTPNEANGNFQYAVNGGAHTLAPPTNTCNIIVKYTNNGSAGAITTSGFTKVTGSSFTTTNTNKFICYITKINSDSHLNVVALQ